MGDYETLEYPSTRWTLREWWAAVGARQSDILKASIHIKPISGRWNDSALARFKAVGIREHRDALAMVALLHRFAVVNKRPILTGRQFQPHVSTFLRSRACRVPFAYPTAEELAEYFIRRLERTPYDPAYGLVLPPPPEVLIGRDDELRLVLEALDKHRVIAIDGIAGIGKTALAWFAAQTALDQAIIVGFDWNTDKRTVYSRLGDPVPTELPPLTYERILVSMAHRFGWTDLLGCDLPVLEAGCQRKLADNRYLIVVDNLDSLDDADTLARRLRELIGVGRSRLLFTSRREVTSVDCCTVKLSGLSWVGRIDFLEQWEATAPRRLALTNAQRQQILRLTDGHPLLLRTTLERCAMARQPNVVTRQIEWLSGKDGGRDRMFPALFGCLREWLPPPALWLAEAVAQYSDRVEAQRLSAWWAQQYPDDPDGLDAALAHLIYHRVLDPSPAESGVYLMPLAVRAYLRAAALSRRINGG